MQIGVTTSTAAYKTVDISCGVLTRRDGPGVQRHDVTAYRMICHQPGNPASSPTKPQIVTAVAARIPALELATTSPTLCNNRLVQ